MDVKLGRFVCHFLECNMKFYYAQKLVLHCSQEHDLTIGSQFLAMLVNLISYIAIYITHACVNTACMCTRVCVH